MIKINLIDYQRVSEIQEIDDIEFNEAQREIA